MTPETVSGGDSIDRQLWPSSHLFSKKFCWSSSSQGLAAAAWSHLLECIRFGGNEHH